MVRMVTESGRTDLTVNPDEVTRDEVVGVGHLMLDGETAAFAVTALGRSQRLFIEGKEYRLVGVRLREVARALSHREFHEQNAIKGQTDPEGALADLDARYHDRLPEGTNCHLCGIEHAPINPSRI